MGSCCAAASGEACPAWPALTASHPLWLQSSAPTEPPRVHAITRVQHFFWVFRVSTNILGFPSSHAAPAHAQVDGLIVNCSAFNPTPSLSAAVVNHFKFKSSIRTFNLSGMGCAASVIAVDMAREMLKVGSNFRR